MLLVLCVDLDNDLGRKTEYDTPIVGRDQIEDVAVSLATTDPEDSDVNVLFEGLHIYDSITDEGVAVAAVAGIESGEVKANRKVGEEVDTVLANLQSSEPVKAIVVTDGAQDESVIPVIRSRIPIDSVRRVVVRQAQDLESMYYTLKQVLDDPETRGTILVPLGVILLMYPLAVIANYLGLPGLVLGLSSTIVGLYALFRGLGMEEVLNESVETLRNALYTGRVTIITYVVALALLVIGGVEGYNLLRRVTRQSPSVRFTTQVAAFVNGAVIWAAAAALTSSLGQITDEYLADRFKWRYLNAPFYILAITAVSHAVSGYLLGKVTLSYLAAVLTTGTLLGILSTLAFAMVESRQAKAA
ncbi:MAG: DUF373 family protein [Halobacteriaceae archaeon]